MVYATVMRRNEHPPLPSLSLFSPAEKITGGVPPEEYPTVSTAPQEVEGGADAATGVGGETEETPEGENATEGEEGETSSRFFSFLFCVFSFVVLFCSL